MFWSVLLFSGALFGCAQNTQGPTSALTPGPSTTVAPTSMSPTVTPSLAPTSMPPTVTVLSLAPTSMPPTVTAPTNVAPTTVAPTSMSPTVTVLSLAPTSMSPTVTAPTTVAPTNGNVAPTNAAPTNAAPTNAAPTNAAPTNARAPTPATTSYPANTVSQLTTEVIVDVVATCAQLATFADNFRAQLAQSLGVTQSSITITASGCPSTTGRRLLAATTLTIVVTTNASDAQANSAATQQFLTSSAFTDVATSSSITINGTPKVNPTTFAVNGCGVSFLAFANACSCPSNMTDVAQCSALCTQKAMVDCKASVSALVNCTTDVGLGAIVTAVRTAAGRCAPSVNAASQASLGMLAAIALIGLPVIF